MNTPLSPDALLRWYLDAGVDEAVGKTPRNWFAAPASPAAPRTEASTPPQPATRPAPRPPTAASLPIAPPPATSAAIDLARACSTIEELKAAVEAYEGCPLKRTAQRTVFADGNPRARVMLVGEGPGADEDRIGLPFVGVSGQLLDRMLASIGLDRTSEDPARAAYITNVVFWRPPQNRKPEPGEVESCRPFIERLVELVDPAILVMVGGAAANALLGRPDSIGRLRGHWHEYAPVGFPHPISALATFHPAYLLRTPQQKRLAWHDFLTIRKRLDGAA